jgi:hypothetical protein
MSSEQSASPPTVEVAARCHEIQVCLAGKQVPEFESIGLIGMAVRLALHIRGLPLIGYDVLRMVAVQYLDIPALALPRLLSLLADVEFVRLQTQGDSIKAVLPNVPYYEGLYNALGEYASSETPFNEAETLSLAIVERLSKAPHPVDSLHNRTGAERKLFDRALQIGHAGRFLVRRRSRGKDIVLSPTYFSENADVFADLVAAQGAGSVRRVLEAIKSMQGVPLALVRKTKSIGGIRLSDAELTVLTRLAQDGAVKPPSIKTTHAGENHFLFTPTPSGAALPATKREIYERAMAIVAAVRQGQLLAKSFRIHSPGAVLYTLRTKLKLGKATTEATEQYRNLVHLRIGRLIAVGNGFSEFRIIDTEENREALDIAYQLVEGGVAQGIEIDESARRALQQPQEYVEAMIASAELRTREVVALDREQQLELDILLSGGNL